MQVSYIKFNESVIEHAYDIDCRLRLEFGGYSRWTAFDIWVNLALFYVNDDENRYPDLNYLKIY